MSGAYLLHCSFCGKSHHEVAHMIAGPTVFICDGCVELCVEIVVDMKTRKIAWPGTTDELRNDK